MKEESLIKKKSKSSDTSSVRKEVENINLDK